MYYIWAVNLVLFYLQYERTAESHMGLELVVYSILFWSSPEYHCRTYILRSIERKFQRLTAIFCNPDVVVGVWSVPPREHHDLFHHPAVVSGLKDVQRVSESSVPRCQRTRIDCIVILQVEVPRQLVTLYPALSVRRAPDVSASILES